MDKEIEKLIDEFLETNKWVVEYIPSKKGTDATKKEDLIALYKEDTENFAEVVRSEINFRKNTKKLIDELRKAVEE